MKVMGFDSLYTAAWLEAHGPSPVESPLVLERREAPSTLAIASSYQELGNRPGCYGGKSRLGPMPD
jgi:hypothetical protein